MSKRNITHRSGKQLYLNQIFLKGMLYTSSEMQEGFAKVIDNYDIAPTGDAASPRQPFRIPQSIQSIDSKYTFPVKFKQLKNAQAYVRFNRTISEDEFTSDTLTNPTDHPGKTIDVLYRTNNAFNDGSLELKQVDYNIIDSDASDTPEVEEDSVVDKTKNVVNVSFDSPSATISISENSDRAQKNSTIDIESSNNITHAASENLSFTLENIDFDSIPLLPKYPCTITLTLSLNRDIAKKNSNTASMLYAMKQEGIYANVDYILQTPNKNSSLEGMYIKSANDFGRTKINSIEFCHRGNYSYNGDNDPGLDITYAETPLQTIVEASESDSLNPFIYDSLENKNPIIKNYYPIGDTFLGLEITTSDGSLIRSPNIVLDNENRSAFESPAFGTSILYLEISIYGNNINEAYQKLQSYIDNNSNAFYAFAKCMSIKVSEKVTLHALDGDKDAYNYVPNFQETDKYTIETSFNYLLENNNALRPLVSAATNNLLRKADEYKNTLYHHDSMSNIEVIDGDTFKLEGKSYRLWAADSVEKGYKWYTYTKWFLESLLTNLSIKNTYLKFNYKSTSFDREVSNIEIFNSSSISENNSNLNIRYELYSKDYFNGITIPIKKYNKDEQVFEDTLKSWLELNRESVKNITYAYKKIFENIQYDLHYNHTPLVDIFLKTGLYTLRAGIENYTTEDEFKYLTSIQNEAIAFGYYRWWEDSPTTTLYFTDPYYGADEIITGSTDSDTTLKITDDMYIEAVKLYDEYNISAVTKTKLDYVHAIYIDYLDAVGFIGRIVNYKTNKIVYKGLILLKADITDEGITYFKILLPNNQGEGYEPSILEAVESGYNLYNTELLHVKNTMYTESPFALNGLAILKTQYKDGVVSVDEDNPILISQAVVGQTISLSAVLNEGYYVNSGIHNTDKWGYNIHIEIPNITFTNDGVEVQKEKFSTIITKPLSNTHNIYYYSKNIYELVKEDFTDISFSEINITKVELITPTNELVEITPVLSTINLSSNSTIADVLVYDHSLFELKLKVTTNDNREYLAISIYDNFSSPNKTLSSTSGNIELVDRTETPLLTKEFYSQWFVDQASG